MSSVRNEKGQFVKGYNGDKLGTKHTEETKIKIKEARARQGSNVWNKGTHESGMKGKKRTEEWKIKMRKIFLGKPRPDLRKERKYSLSPIISRIRNSYSYRQWRSDVLTRDDFTCQLCGIRGGKLNADHYPKIFSIIIKEYNIKTYIQAMECEELWNINNGRTLCVACHRKYGINPRNKK